MYIILFTPHDNNNMNWLTILSLLQALLGILCISANIAKKIMG